MMLLDIQGCAYHLYNPDIATNDPLDNDGEIYFCSGNLSIDAIKMFGKQHKCNPFCEMLNLPVFEIRDVNKDKNDGDKSEGETYKHFCIILYIGPLEGSSWGTWGLALEWRRKVTPFLH